MTEFPRTETCGYANDNMCDYDTPWGQFCWYGTDCGDCGPAEAPICGNKESSNCEGDAYAPCSELEEDNQPKHQCATDFVDAPGCVILNCSDGLTPTEGGSRCEGLDCENTCRWPFDGWCDGDGSTCDRRTDCGDCGKRDCPQKASQVTLFSQICSPMCPWGFGRGG